MACLSYLERLRWPHRFTYPDCAGITATYRASRTRFIRQDHCFSGNEFMLAKVIFVIGLELAQYPGGRTGPI